MRCWRTSAASAPAQTPATLQRDALGFVIADGGRRNRGQREPDGGELTALVYAARSGSVDAARVLLDAGADVNQTTRYGWSPLLAATQNRNYQLGKFLIERGADVNLANKGGWTPLYLATDNRNLEGGDYPTRTPDMDDLDYIKLLLDAGADVNAQVIESTETRTVFTNQWLDEEGATAFLRASQSGDVELMKLLLEHGADPKINTKLGVTPLAAAAGIGWVEGVTSERSPAETVEAVKLLLELGIDPNFQADTGRVALHGAAHKGATEVVKVLVAAGARMDIRDFGNTDNRGSAELAAHTWLRDRLRRRARARRRAVRHPASRNGEGAARSDDRGRARGAARRAHARVDLHRRSVLAELQPDRSQLAIEFARSRRDRS